MSNEALKPVLYHEGNLAADRYPKHSRDEKALNLSAKADEYWSLAEAGIYYLVQKRISVDWYEYWAYPKKELA